MSSVSCSGWKTNLVIISLDCREPFLNKDGLTDIFEQSRSLNCSTEPFIFSSLFYEVVSDSSMLFVELERIIRQRCDRLVPIKMLKL